MDILGGIGDFLGTTEGFLWIAILEGICALGVLGLFFKSLMMFAETEHVFAWLPIIALAGIVATSIGVFAIMDFAIWLV